ncbi:MAG TPA: ribosome recycling factor [bacterium]|nr:ribosome recycling factor [bacterium]
MLKKELGSVRTGRASAELLAPVAVDYYGTKTPLNQMATIHTPEPQLIVVTPYDRSQVKEVEKAIKASDLGLNPITEGGVIRVPVPVLTEERRKELVKHVRKLGEDAKVAVRNIRREGNERLKKLEKGKEISQDQEKEAEGKIQGETDANIHAIDELVKKKEKELLTV